ncbi:MAG: adenosylcobinamide-phosphate synthase [Micavibrio aeruginosavorus]|uniref:Adenosylcobinamide-phosphate synthase n=1 Tax=Micavibrio aeruginosavorus TaxID=349221 RepID=A0A2W5N0G1_9BACT|nr:MAG: adenosylcobinamide-phosphate synthase [Micavibrio aeruginosavorus]
MSPAEIYSQLHDLIMDPTRLPIAAAAIILVSVIGVLFGPLMGNANPVFWRAVDFLFGPLGSRLDKTERKAADLMTRGLIVTIIALVLGFMVGTAFQSLSAEYANYLVVDIVALSLVMSAGAGWHALIRLYKAMSTTGQVKGAFYTLAATTRSNLSIADEFTITRVGIGMGARLFDKGIVGPVLWYLIAGLPAAYIYATLAALSWRFGKEGFTKGFGASALSLEKLMGFVPNVFSGLLLALAGILTPTAGMTRSFIGLLRVTKGRAGYFQGGSPVTAMAYALKVSLGGATQDVDGSAIKRGWAGPDGATAKLDAKHLHRALYILVMAHLLFLGAVLSLVVLRGHGLI